MERWDRDLASIIDHTILASSATENDVQRVCSEAIRYGFASAVVQPYYVSRAVELLRGAPVAVCSVVSFPFGADPVVEKAHAVEVLIRAGAGEIDMVMNVGAFLSGKLETVKEEMNLLGSLCGDDVVSKIIIETANLDDKAIRTVCEMGVEAGIDFIKTSTGYAARGASVEDVKLIRSVVGERAGVKASGGVRTREFALKLVEAGATRIGCSRSLDLIRL